MQTNYNIPFGLGSFDSANDPERVCLDPADE